ncbi:MAG: DUF2693 domain-containing protein [Prevotella sp.]|nr:DUF2693 domain-containing protein [Prevotella sp.]
MEATFKTTLKQVMSLAWQFVRKNGLSLSDALKTAWLNIKLKAQMKKRIVKFYFQKIDGSIREAYGTLKESMLPPTSGKGNQNPTTQCYFDTEKGEYRCFKKANLIRINL